MKYIEIKGTSLVVVQDDMLEGLSFQQVREGLKSHGIKVRTIVPLNKRHLFWPILKKWLGNGAGCYEDFLRAKPDNRYTLTDANKSLRTFVIKHLISLEVLDHLYICDKVIVKPDSDFLIAARPLMEYLAKNHHPHYTAMVTSTNANLMEGKEGTGPIYDYVED